MSVLAIVGTVLVVLVALWVVLPLVIILGLLAWGLLADAVDKASR